MFLRLNKKISVLNLNLCSFKGLKDVSKSEQKNK